MIVVFATKSFSVTNPGTKPASIGAIVGLPVDCVLIRLGIGVRSTTKKETGLENTRDRECYVV